MAELVCFTTAYSTPEFIPYQRECLRKFITVPFIYYVFDNAPTNDIAAKNKDMAAYSGAIYVRIPTNPYAGNPSGGAGYSINFALQYIYNTLNYRKTVMCIDSDMFPVVPFNPIERLGTYDFVGIEQNREHVKYYTNQLFIMNFKNIKDINELDFLPSNIDGQQCDCGGKLYTFFKNNSELTVNSFNTIINSGKINNENINDICPEVFKEYFKSELTIINPSFAEIYENTFLHYRAGSNWIGHSSDVVFKRSDLLYTFLCNRLIDWNMTPSETNKYIISVVLYGNSPKYTYNGIINAIIAKKVYKGWIVRYYVDDTVPENIINTLKLFDNVEVVPMTSIRSPAGSERMLWRFHPASEPDVAAMISRGLDSWISFRDAALTKQWIDSNKGLHIIRDHCYHSQKIMGGMWGIKRGVFPQMKELCDTFSQTDTYDQGFLANTVYPACVNDSIVHANENQKKMGGAPANGYFPDNGIPFPKYPKIRHYIPDLDIEYVNSMNLFNCLHCRSMHPFFIGNMINNIPQELTNIVNIYIK